MKSNIKDEKGFTLVELLASLALLSIVILLVGSVHLFGQKQFQAQSYSANQANDVAYSLNMLSRELRRAESVKVEEGIYNIDNNSYYKFNSKDHELIKDTEVIAENIIEFNIKLTDNNEGVVVTIETNSFMTNDGKSYQTTIYFRRDVVWEEFE